VYFLNFALACEQRSDILHPNEFEVGQGTTLPVNSAYRPVEVKGRVLPMALINAQAATKHPHNCMDIKKGGRRALHAILAFYNLKTRAAIFPSREVLAREAGVSIQTLYRDLAELEMREYIVRLPQKHKSAAAGANAGKFWLAPIQLTQKALVLLGLEKVIHKETSLKMRDGIYIDKEHTKEIQSSLKNTISAESGEGKVCRKTDAVDRQTKLPKDLLTLHERGISCPGIFLLMKLARSHGKRLSDIVAYRLPRIMALDLRSRALFSYLRELVSVDVDFAHMASTVREAQHATEELKEAQALQARLHRHCDGFEIRNGEEVIGIFRAASNPEDCGFIEMAGGSRPFNVKAALAMLKSKLTVSRSRAYADSVFN
jgi:hypothetical protein